MEKRLNKYLFFYLTVLLSFSYFFLSIKYQVGNDSTISEWLINYEGGFTKRGIIGQLAIEFSRFFNSELRWTIFLMQCFTYSLYFFLLYNFLKNLKYERVVILSIFTPIFILYPIAEIEVLARKEIIVFSFFIIYSFVPRINQFKTISFIIFTVLSVLVWEPIIFFFPIILVFELIDNKIEKIDFNFVKILFSFLPSIIIAIIFILDPLAKEEHLIMRTTLLNEFGEKCYMSCALLASKSTILQQFEGNFGKYSFEVFLRYFLIILIGFFPLFTLIKNSYLKNNNLLFIKYFKNPLTLFLICLSPVPILFAMAYDWGRWVNITYVILALTYFRLLIDNHFSLNFEKLSNSFFYKIKGKFFIFFFVIFCFGWNPKTVITGDVASFPGYRVPYKVFKILSN